MVSATSAWRSLRPRPPRTGGAEYQLGEPFGNPWEGCGVPVRAGRPAGGVRLAGERATVPVAWVRVVGGGAATSLADVTVVADAGMISDTNKHASETARLSFILGAKIPDITYARGPVAV